MGNNSSLMDPCTNVSCKTTFSSNGNSVNFFGNIAHGGFESNTDIAGLGTLIAFFLPTLGIISTSFILLLSLVQQSAPKDSTGPIITFLTKIPLPTPDPHHPFAGPKRSKPKRPAPSSSWHQGHAPQSRGHSGYRNPNQFRDRHQPSYYLGGSQTHNHLAHGSASFSEQYPLQELPPRRLHVPQYIQQHLGSMDTQNSAYESITTEDYSSEHMPLPDDMASISEKTPNPFSLDKWRSRLYDLLEAALLCVSDSQMLLAIALLVYFFLKGQCETSQYHFQTGINLALLACTNFVLSLALTRDYWKARCAAALRLSCAIVVFFLLGYFYIIRVFQRKYTAEGGVEGPPLERNDSLILLSAVCFMHARFADDVRELNTTLGQQELVGRLNDSPQFSFDFIFYIILVLATAILLLFYFVRSSSKCFKRFFSGKHHDDEEETARHPIAFVSLAGILITALTVFVCMTVASTANNKEWVRQSGWLADGDEQGINSFGQIAALVAMGTVLIAMFDKVVREPS